MLFLYSLSIFIGALLLFAVEPLFAHMVLPSLGGVPAVWNTAMVFYQGVLLGGYLYAHAITKWLHPKYQVFLHVTVLLAAILFLPIEIPSGWLPPTDANPIPSLLTLLLLAVGLPFFVISATSPLMQKWFGISGHRYSQDPYFLYAASNAGSMTALLIYPALMEPLWTLGEQSRYWSFCFILLIVLIGICAANMWRANRATRSTNPVMGSAIPQSESAKESPHVEMVSRWRKLRWIALAFVPSSLMLSVTSYITTDIASVPLLWIIPLAIYLATFILVFARRSLIPHFFSAKAMPLALIPMVIALAIRVKDPIFLVIPLHLASFFFISMVCHGELAADRPAVSRLTEFYIYLSLGGVLGGIFNALIAPLIFSSVVEYPLGLILACAFLPWNRHESLISRARIYDIIWPIVLGAVALGLIMGIQATGIKTGAAEIAVIFGIPACVSFSFSRRPIRFALAIAAIFYSSTYFIGSQGKVLLSQRSFFGVSRVTVDEGAKYHQYMHGSTLHGRQWIDPSMHREPVAYYHKSGPLGQIFQAMHDEGRIKRVGIVGLGAGGISAYARSGEKWTYYEIDPVVVQIARDTRFFTYLHDCPADLQVVLGDGRLSLKSAEDGFFDLLILDAYSSDSLPVHLITFEALKLYLQKITDHGVLAFNISNRYLDLEPALLNVAAANGLFCRIRNDTVIGPADAESGKLGTIFVVMARTASDLGPVANDAKWKPLRASHRVGLWTDDYSSIISILRWNK